MDERNQQEIRDLEEPHLAWKRIAENIELEKAAARRVALINFRAFKMEEGETLSDMKRRFDLLVLECTELECDITEEDKVAVLLANPSRRYLNSVEATAAAAAVTGTELTASAVRTLATVTRVP